jgi:hypothetical protein
MEINSRFWGSLQLAISSGIDFPSILLSSAKNEPLESTSVTEYRIGVRNRWLWGDFDSVLMILFKNRTKLNLPVGHSGRISAILSFLKSFCSELNYDVLSFDDIRPWLRETAQRVGWSREKKTSE